MKSEFRGCYQWVNGLLLKSRKQRAETPRGDKMMNLVFKNDKLFAVDESGFVGQIINDVYGRCVENPDESSPGEFSMVFGGHGYIYHQSDNPPNPFFVASWAEVFGNSGLLPTGTVNVFVDCGQDAEDNFNARMID